MLHKKPDFFKKIDKKSIFRPKIDFPSPTYKYNLYSYFLQLKSNEKTAKKIFFGIFEKRNALKKETRSVTRFFFRQKMPKTMGEIFLWS